MPREVKSELDQRREFVRLALIGEVSVSELCRRFGISRQTGHLLLRRYRADGEAGLLSQSRRPTTSPRATGQAMVEQILAIRSAHPAWGGRKIRHRLLHLGLDGVPAASTITGILGRQGLIDAQEGAHPRPFQRFERGAPNELWQMDFKGHFPTLEGRRCHPLTVLDDHSRYSLAVRACSDETLVTVRGHLTTLFRQYGLPQAMLADNGPPWGGAGHADADTALGIWLMLLGVRLYHGRPHHPQTQGKEERFHRTLRCEVIQHTTFRDLDHCQQAFDAWRPIYNEQRPHHSLDMAVPASRYKPSPRTFPEQLPLPEYDVGTETRRVQAEGYFTFKGRRCKVSQAFRGYSIGLRPRSCPHAWCSRRLSIAFSGLPGRDGHAATVGISMMA